MAQDPRVCGGESLVPRESAGGAQKKGEAVAGGEGRWSSGGRAATLAGRGPWWFIRLDRLSAACPSQHAPGPSGQAELSARRVGPDLLLAGPWAPRGLRVH